MYFLKKKLIKIYLFFVFVKNRIIYVKYFLKVFFKDINNIYKFDIKDRYLGAKAFSCGYGDNNIKEVSSNFNEDLDLIKIESFYLFVPKKIFAREELSNTYKEIFTFFGNNPHSYETDFIKINKGDVVFDIGAAEGLFSLHALKKDASKVFLFEPFSLLEIGLKKTFEHEIHNGKVNIIMKGLLDYTGISKFKRDCFFVGSSKFDDSGEIFVDNISIDEFVFKEHLFNIDFIKMDIEDSEIKCVKGALNSIKKFKPKMSIAVYHSYINAIEIKKMILDVCPEYKIKFRGCYMFDRPYRPYMLYAYV